MIYLDNGATSMEKPWSVCQSVCRAMNVCGNPGRGGYPASMEAARVVYRCRERASELFDCQPEQVVFTANCTHGLNMAIRSLVSPGERVAISGFEHNAVTRPLHLLGAKTLVAGQKLFDPDDTLKSFEKVLQSGVKAAVFTHVSNVFGYILPIKEMAVLCRKYRVPFIIDAAQSAGILPVHLRELGADFIAMPGHKGLLGPQGTGLLLCGRELTPLLAGGTGSESRNQNMPEALPERGEAGTLNVPGIAGLSAGIGYISQQGLDRIFAREERQMRRCVRGLQALDLPVFAGRQQIGTVSFVPPRDCQEFSEALAGRGIAVRGGLHCAPLAHQSAGTLESGTVRVSFGHNASDRQTDIFIGEVKKVLSGQ
ncbi:MAG: aminotransferase class V-fold PLP-dependent enzyme [Oscillospiraceae bacterium]|nr:aminotransferase class V-fold PLP-dependent enzyme [Oscillospiraceae bacterium]